MLTNLVSLVKNATGLLTSGSAPLLYGVDMSPPLMVVSLSVHVV